MLRTFTIWLCFRMAFFFNWLGFRIGNLSFTFRKLALLAAYKIALLFVLAFPIQAHASNFWVDLGGGMTHFMCSICDAKDSATASFAQMGLPNDISRDRLSWRAGVGLQLSENWSVPLYYWEPGQMKIRQHYTVDDAQYNPKTHSCLAPCLNAGEFDSDDKLRGVSLGLRRTFGSFYAGAGGAVFHHHLTFSLNNGTHNMLKGTLPMAYGSIGWQESIVYAEANYFRGFGGGTEWSAGLPLSKEWVSLIFGIRLRL